MFSFCATLYRSQRETIRNNSLLMQYNQLSCGKKYFRKVVTVFSPTACISVRNFVSSLFCYSQLQKIMEQRLQNIAPKFGFM